jgi:hypothetical protein
MLFTPGPLKFRESAYERGEAGFMFLAIEPCPMPSPNRSFHWEVEKADVTAGLEVHTPDNLAVISARLIHQEKVVLEQREVRRNAKKCFTKVDKNSDLKNGIRVEMD